MTEHFDILVVDDSASDAEFFRSALHEAQPGASMHWLRGGAEAIAYLEEKGAGQRSPVKLVVLDLNMPGLSGLETLKQIKSIPKIQDVPVVIFSSSTLKQEIDSAYSLGASGFLNKPISMIDFFEGVRVLAYYWLCLAKLPSVAMA